MMSSRRRIAVLMVAVSTAVSARRPAALRTQAADAPRIAFDVASIKSNTSGDVRTSMQPLPGGRFTATNIPTRAVIRFAFEIQDFQIDGGPGWLTDDRFDIIAKADGDPPLAQMRAMVKSLLADRFALRVHNDTRELPSYALLLSRSDRKLGPQLRPTEADCSSAPLPVQLGGPLPRDPSGRCGYLGPTPGASLASGRATMAFRGLTMDAFARFLMPMLRRSVLDRTGLTGYFDGDFDPSAEFPPPPPPPGIPDPFDRQSFPTIFTVLREQLGLKLDTVRAPTTIVVVDRIEKPTED